MSSKSLETLKKSIEAAKQNPEQLQNLLNEMGFFFDTIRGKLKSEDPDMGTSAIQEIRRLRAFLEGRSAINLSI